jgi:hypothetical protein
MTKPYVLHMNRPLVFMWVSDFRRKSNRSFVKHFICLQSFEFFVKAWRYRRSQAKNRQIKIPTCNSECSLCRVAIFIAIIFLMTFIRKFIILLPFFLLKNIIRYIFIWVALISVKQTAWRICQANALLGSLRHFVLTNNASETFCSLFFKICHGSSKSAFAANQCDMIF